MATKPRVLPSTLRTSAVRKSFSLTNLKAMFLIVSSDSLIALYTIIAVK